MSLDRIPTALGRRLLPHSLRGQFALALSILALLILAGGATAVYALRTSSTAIRQLAEERLVRVQDAQDLVDHTSLIQREADQLLTTDSLATERHTYADIVQQLEELAPIVARVAAASADLSVLDLHQSSQLFRNMANIVAQLRDSTLQTNAAFAQSLENRTSQLQAASTPGGSSLTILLYELRSASSRDEVQQLRDEFSRQAQAVPNLPEAVRADLMAQRETPPDAIRLDARDPFSLRLRLVNERELAQRFHDQLLHQAVAMVSAARQQSTYFTRDYRQAVQRLINISRRDQHCVLVLLAGSLLFAWLIIRVFLDRHVIARLQQVSRALLQRDVGKANPVVPVAGLDEIGDMARAVERFLEDRQQLARARVSLEEEQQRLAAIIDHTADGIVVLQDDVVRQLNPAAEQLFGGRGEELIGQHLSALVSQFGEPADDTSTRPRDALGRTRDGRTFPIEVSLSEVATQNGSLVILVVRDGTLRKEVERHLTAARDAAVAAQRAQATFLANMSHELRTPLNSILGYAQILKWEKGLSERQTGGLDTIRSSGEHLLTLINDLLDLSKIEAGKLELCLSAVNLQAFLQVIGDIICVKAEQKGLLFALEASPALPRTVLVDEKRLRQVLLNLLGNAVKFTDRGQVSLHVQPLSGTESNRGVSFMVRDTGVGVSEDQLETIFHPFEQVGEVARRTGGTGLGLAISRQLVRSMGGDIRIKSQPTSGSVVWFELSVPVVDVEVAVQPANRRITGYQERHRGVLIVDDVAPNRAMLVDMLAPLGFGVREAANGQEALEQARLVRPDLILMDMTMPVMDGLQATRQIRQTPDLAQVPVIIVSASASRDDQRTSLAAGASAFMTKPIDPNDLLKQIGQHLNLTWVYEQVTEEAGVEGECTARLVPPPREEMDALYKLALTGNMRDIRQKAIHLAVLDPRYQPFAERLQQLAAECQSKSILGLVETYMDRT